MDHGRPQAAPPARIQGRTEGVDGCPYKSKYCIVVGTPSGCESAKSALAAGSITPSLARRTAQARLRRLASFPRAHSELTAPSRAHPTKPEECAAAASGRRESPAGATAIPGCRRRRRAPLIESRAQSIWHVEGREPMGASIAGRASARARAARFLMRQGSRRRERATQQSWMRGVVGVHGPLAAPAARQNNRIADGRKSRRFLRTWALRRSQDTVKLRHGLFCRLGERMAPGASSRRRHSACERVLAKRWELRRWGGMERRDGPSDFTTGRAETEPARGNQSCARTALG